VSANKLVCTYRHLFYTNSNYARAQYVVGNKESPAGAGVKKTRDVKMIAWFLNI